CDQLETIGIQRMVTAPTVATAWASLRDEVPDVVLSAMHLEDTTGAKMLTEMRSMELYRDVPFILVSSEMGAQYLEPVKQSGVTAIIKKPCKEADLKRALHRTLELVHPRPVEISPQVLNGLHVLIVDDSRAARRYITRVLTSLGLQHFTEAEDGQVAIELIDRVTFDFVVTDYNMPRVDGQGLLRYIRNESTQSNIPVLMVTSESNEARLGAVSQLGVSAMCDKPFAPDTVRRLIVGLVASG
ncbi:MAG: response regulator, partial [Myxococcota bacterium]